MKKLRVLRLLLIGLLLAGCSNSPTGSDDNKNDINNNSNDNITHTYYLETGGISTTANDLINSTPGITAEQALAYCNQYAVFNDIYKDAEAGYSRADLETDLEKLEANVNNFHKDTFLRNLDLGGAYFQVFVAQNGDLIYAYVEEE